MIIMAPLIVIVFWLMIGINFELSRSFHIGFAVVLIISIIYGIIHDVIHNLRDELEASIDSLESRIEELEK